MTRNTGSVYFLYRGNSMTFAKYLTEKHKLTEEDYYALDAVRREDIYNEYLAVRAKALMQKKPPAKIYRRYLKNPWVRMIVGERFWYTPDFRGFVRNELENGTPHAEIFRKAGFDPRLLGKDRIQSYISHVRRLYDLPGATGKVEDENSVLKLE